MVGCVGQIETNDEKSDQSEYGNPTTDLSSRTGVYIPKNIEEAFIELGKIVGNEGANEIRTSPDENMSEYHLGLGVWLRNKWGLWEGSSMTNYFKELGICHPDDMTGIILTTFWRKVNNQAINLQELIRSYQAYWQNLGSSACS